MSKSTKQLKVELFLTSDYATISREGKLSVLGIFNNISTNNLPVNLPQFFIVAVVAGEKNDQMDLKISITSPSGKQALPEKELRMPLGDNGKTNLMIDIQNFPFEEVGKYAISLSTNSTTIGEAEIEIIKTMSQQSSNSSAQ